MSMSAEEVLFSCKKQFDFIKTDIKALLAYIEELIKHCQEIDNSIFFQDKLQEYKKRVMDEIADLNQIEKYANQNTKDTHIAIERYHEIQKQVEKKRSAIADLKTEMYALKKDVVKKEQDTIARKVMEMLSTDYESLKNEIVNLQNNLDDKVLAKNYFEKNEAKLINQSKGEIISAINKYMIEIKESSKQIAKDIINQTINLYKDDQDLVNAIKNDAWDFLQNVNETNIFTEANKFVINASRNAEQEAVRKDAVIKIVKAIRDVGYIVNESNIRRVEEKNLILIHGEKVSGETASFAVRLDGSFVYNYEGFEGKEHDVDAKEFLKKLREEGIQSTEEFNKQYHEPKYIAKRNQMLQNKKKDSNK